jgi:tRNA threonylcarbamoyl adenosine modification protein (Sua5/YciO/YrdC/YwlC family)
VTSAVTGDIDAAAGVIAAGGVIVIPTDTVYGIACDPRAAAAVERVYRIKRRPEGMELSILGARIADLEEHGVLDGAARRLGSAYWPGPLSLVVSVAHPGRFAVPRHGATVSLRVPGHGLLRELLARTGPLASTSANRHGEPAAINAEEALAAVGEEVDLVVEGGSADGRGSTIIDLTEVPPRVLRVGPLSLEELRPHLGD